MMRTHEPLPDEKPATAPAPAPRRALEPRSTASAEIELVMDAEAIVKRNAEMTSIVRRIMKVDVHFGKPYPRSDEMRLLQPGVDTLNRAFGLQPRFDVVRCEQRDDFISYTIRCELVTRQGAVISEALGSCNSREEKYRWRVEYLWNETIPEEYFRLRDPSLLPAGCIVKKKGERWVMVRRLETDPWDHDNTILKMAEKRAKSSATENCLAANGVLLEALASKGKDDAGAVHYGDSRSADWAAQVEDAATAGEVRALWIQIQGAKAASPELFELKERRIRELDPSGKR